MPSLSLSRGQQPQPPLPRHPGFDPQLQDVHVVPPVVWVEPTFEYRELTREIVAGSAPVTAPELDELGKDGWELVSVLNDGKAAHFYFKRVAR